MTKPRIIAYYLPQFHPIPENDSWWGKDFTEWTNVRKAKALFKGHNQPKIPSELGYYDLRLPEVRELQAQLAREAGVEGFCYWHYWFGGKGRQLLNGIIDEVHQTGKPDFPFCLGWANESWKAKLWRNNGLGDKLLMEQRYGGEEDYRAHFDYVKELFKNPRYIRVDGKPFFLLYKPNQFQDIANFIALWNKWIQEEGIAEGVYFVANLDQQDQREKWINIGFSAVTPSFMQRLRSKYMQKPAWQKFLLRRYRACFNCPVCYDVEMVNRLIVDKAYDCREDVIPMLFPQWDHTPRSGSMGDLIKGANPESFRAQAEMVLKLVAEKKNSLVMLKSWNEWGEGNYMEPDTTFGRGFINALKSALKK